MEKAVLLNRLFYLMCQNFMIKINFFIGNKIKKTILAPRLY